MGNFNRAVSEKVEAERVIFKKEMAAMAGKLQAIEQTLKRKISFILALDVVMGCLRPGEAEGCQT